jgi:hypothetical protein
MHVTVSNAEAVDVNTKVWYRGSTDPNSPMYTKIGTYGSQGVFLNLNLPLGLTSHSGTSSMDEARKVAIRCLQSKWTLRRRQVQGLVLAGELGKTIQMVVRPAKTLRNKVGSLIGRLAKARKRTTDSSSWKKAAADTWLEGTFGWKPLISDVQNGAIALARTVEKDVLLRHQFRCFGQHESPVLTTTGFAGPIGYDSSSPIYFHMDRRVTSRSQCILYGVWSTKLQSPEVAASAAWRLATLSGLSWADVPPQVWELIPWSFVVDYFINVGDVIESAANTLDGPLWVEEVQILETEDLRYFTHNTQQLKAFLGKLFVALDGPDPSSKQSFKTISRLGYLGPLQTQLSLRLPVDMQWLNLAALAAGGKSLQPFTNR